MSMQRNDGRIVSCYHAALDKGDAQSPSQATQNKYSHQVVLNRAIEEVHASEPSQVPICPLSGK
jgi:hypothetical protein